MGDEIAVDDMVEDITQLIKEAIPEEYLTTSAGWRDYETGYNQAIKDIKKNLGLNTD